MAQWKHVETSLVLPLRLGASIDPIGDALCVGEWIVGYAPIEDERQLYHPKEFDFEGNPPEDWLASYFALIQKPAFRSSPPHPELVRRTLVRDGTFRVGDWVEIDEALSRNIPNEVKAEIRRSKLGRGKRVYLLRAEDFWDEWRLLESLALLAGTLGEHKNTLHAKKEIEAAVQLFNKLLERDKRIAIKRTVAPIVSMRLPLADQVRLEIRDVVQRAFWRILGKPVTNFRYSNKSGPWLYLEAKSLFAVAYITLLKHFTRGWKRCKRPDCGTLFRVTDDKRKTFCSQYCGHLDNLRKKRREAKSKRQSKFRRGGKH